MTAGRSSTWKRRPLLRSNCASIRPIPLGVGRFVLRFLLTNPARRSTLLPSSYYSQIEPSCSQTDRQVTLRSLTTFFLNRFAIWERWGISVRETESLRKRSFPFPTFRLASSIRGACIVAPQAVLLAVPDAPPRFFAHWARSASVPQGAVGSGPPTP